MNTTASVAVPEKGLLARIFGVIFSPRETYADVAARPRPFPVLLVAIDHRRRQLRLPPHGGRPARLGGSGPDAA